MPGFGFGFGPRAATRRKPPADGYVLVAWPSAAWNGTAGSGFATVPSDPVRTTAKPAMRLIVPPNQPYTDQLLVGVFAGANDRGSLINTLGLEKVTVHYEGFSVDITAPVFRTFPDANGNPVTYFGWWISLRHDGRNGHANLYFEAVPRDPTMQRRVMGPYLFSPQAALHDYTVSVAPSLPMVAGSRYPTPAAAIAYLRSVAANNPLMLLAETATYKDWNGTTTYAGKGWLTVQAPAGVTATIAYSGYGGGLFRTKYDGMHFKGQNVIFDMRYIGEINTEKESTGRDHWLDGVRFTNSAGMGNRLWQKRGRPATDQVRSEAYFTECRIEYLSDPVRGCNLARGCTVEYGWSDIMSGCRFAYNTTFARCDNTFVRTEIDAMTVRYTGPGTTATIEISLRPIQDNRVFTVKVDGVSIGTFTVRSTEAGYLAGTNYEIRNVVDWLNSLPGITATLIDDRYGAVWLGKRGVGDAATPATDIKSAPLTMTTRLQTHGDLYAAEGVFENVILVGNRSFNCDLQVLVGGAGGAGTRDWLVLNNGFQHNTSEYFQLLQSQSHVVLAHNSFPTYQLALRTDLAYVPDSYCLVANNVFNRIGGDSTNYGFFKNNHSIQAGTQDAAPGTTIGGTVTTVCMDAVNGNFAPGPLLLVNPKLPVVSFDVSRRLRGPQDAVGAVSTI